MAKRTGECRVCGAETISGERGLVPTICRSCYLANERVAAKRRRPPGQPRVRTCKECSAEYLAVGPGASAFCGADCGKIASRRRQRRYVRRNPARRAESVRNYDAKVSPEVRRERQNRSRAKNPTVYREIKRRRRARENDCKTFRMTERDWLRLVRRYDGKCAYCGGVGPLERDHVVPLSRGGDHGIGNIVPACVRCNRSKLDRLLVEWRYAKVLRQAA